MGGGLIPAAPNACSDMSANHERDLLLGTRAVFRQSVEQWAELHNRWSFRLGMLNKKPVIRVVCVLDGRFTKWFEKHDLEEIASLITLLESRFKMTSIRWIRDGEIEYKLWLRSGMYERKRKEREARKKRMEDYV